jgi:hypothetical protein
MNEDAQRDSAATKDGQDFLTWINRMNRINPMPRMAGPLAWADPILSILFIHVKKLPTAKTIPSMRMVTDAPASYP